MTVKSRHRDVVAAQSHTVRKRWRQGLNSGGGTPNHQCHASGRAFPSSLLSHVKEISGLLTLGCIFLPKVWGRTGRWGWDKGVT